MAKSFTKSNYECEECHNASPDVRWRDYQGPADKANADEAFEAASGYYCDDCWRFLCNE